MIPDPHSALAALPGGTSEARLTRSLSFSDPARVSWGLHDVELLPKLCTALPAEIDGGPVFRWGLPRVGQVSYSGKDGETGSRPDHARTRALGLDPAQRSSKVLWVDTQARQTEPRAPRVLDLPDIVCVFQAYPFSTPSF